MLIMEFRVGSSLQPKLFLDIASTFHDLVKKIIIKKITGSSTAP